MSLLHLVSSRHVGSLLILLNLLFIVGIIKYQSSYSNLYQSKYSNKTDSVNEEKILLVDVDCLQKLIKNEDCEGQLEVAGNSHVKQQNTTFLYYIYDDSNYDHLKFNPVVSMANSIVPRLLPRFGQKIQKVKVKNGGHLFLNVPENIPQFLEFWKKSEFLACKNIKFNRKEERLIPIEKVSIFTEYRTFAEKWNTTFMLYAGTLLGWYRECDIIVHTHDLDLTVPSSMIVPKFIEDIQKTFDVVYVFGRDKDSLEVFWRQRDVRTDLFFKYPYNSTHERAASLNFGPVQTVFAYFPIVNRICAGDLHGRLVYVPCNTEELLEVEFGNWKKEVKTEDFVYFRDPKNLELMPPVPGEGLKTLRRTKWP